VRVSPKTSPNKSRVRNFKASDILKLAGLSYRQLNDWEERADISPPQRTGAAGWRRFSAADVFVLMVCVEIRRQFGVPLESLTWAFNSEESHSQYEFASSRVSAGREIWLATDLRTVFAVSLNSNFKGVLERNKHGVILLRLTPLLKQLHKHQKAAQEKPTRRKRIKP